MRAGRKSIDGAATRMAVAGCGYWGRNLARNFHALGALASVYDRYAERAESLARAFDATPLSFSQILADDSITAVAIATPADTHFAMAREVLLAGKHVFVEKPLALGVDGAQRLCDQADKTQRTLMIGHLLRYHPAFVRLMDMVREGDLGRLRFLYANRLNRGNLRHEKNILWSVAPHDISMMLALVGASPVSVTATGGSYREPGIIDLVTAQLAFTQGRMGHVFVSWLHPSKEYRLVAVGDRATAAFNDCRAWPEKLVIYPADPAGPAVPEPLEPIEPLAAECRHFLECIATGVRPRTDGAESLRVLDVVEAAERSMASGRPAETRFGRVDAAPERLTTRDA